MHAERNAARARWRPAQAGADSETKRARERYETLLAEAKPLLREALQSDDLEGISRVLAKYAPSAEDESVAAELGALGARHADAVEGAKAELVGLVGVEDFVRVQQTLEKLAPNRPDLAAEWDELRSWLETLRANSNARAQRVLSAPDTSMAELLDALRLAARRPTLLAFLSRSCASNWNKSCSQSCRRWRGR